MVCNNCGRQVQNEAANFCEYCGQSFREHKFEAAQAQVQSQAQVHTQTQERINPLLPKQQVTVIKDSTDKPISFLNWLGSYGIFFVPIIGTLLFPVMLLYWSFSNTVPVTKKNWARATLIFTVVLTIWLSMALGVMLSNPATLEFMQGNIDAYEYMNQLIGY